MAKQPVSFRLAGADRAALEQLAKAKGTRVSKLVRLAIDEFIESKGKSIERPRIVLVNRCFVKRDDGKMLIIKRSPNDQNNAGRWEVPGGKLDQGQDLIHALEREVLEETGLFAESVERMAYVDSFTIGDGQYKGMPYVALFHVTKLVGGRFTLSHEHTDHAWVTHDEMLGYDLTEEVRKAAIILKPRL